MFDEYTLLHLAAERSLCEHIGVMLALDFNVNIRSQVSILDCPNYSSKGSSNADYFFLSLRTLNISIMKLRFIVHVRMVRLMSWNI